MPERNEWRRRIHRDPVANTHPNSVSASVREGDRGTVEGMKGALRQQTTPKPAGVYLMISSMPLEEHNCFNVKNIEICQFTNCQLHAVKYLVQSFRNVKHSTLNTKFYTSICIMLRTYPVQIFCPFILHRIFNKNHMILWWPHRFRHPRSRQNGWNLVHFSELFHNSVRDKQNGVIESLIKQLWRHSTT